MSDEILKLAVHPKCAEILRKNLPAWDGSVESLLLYDTFVEDWERSRFLFCTVEQKEPVTALAIPSLRELFRGTRNPGELSGETPEYIPFFAFMENAGCAALKSGNHYSNEDFVEVYSTMRRRPDGKSSGILQDLLWRQAVYFLLNRECSQAEYEACFRWLERTARKNKDYPASLRRYDRKG